MPEEFCAWGSPWALGTSEHADHHCHAECAEAHTASLLRLATVLDRARTGRDLHLTSVRNENAYFSCIFDILRLSDQGALKASATLATSDKPVFVVGDSHVLSSAWRSAKLDVGQEDGGKVVQFVPCLITGAKIWHLRDDSNFYTKYAFWERIGKLPAGAPVIFILGEIDCREGILRAVRRAHHANVRLALGAVVDLYVQVLVKIRKRLRSSSLFVHPVPTVLPETRTLTMGFNALLAEADVKAKLRKANISLLEFPSLLKDGGDDLGLGAEGLSKLELLDEIKLDGTHLSPVYVDTILAPALAESWSAAAAY